MNLRKSISSIALLGLLLFVVVQSFVTQNSPLTLQDIQPAKAAGDFSTQLVKITIPISSTSTTATAPADFTAVTPSSTIALISGVTQHALGNRVNATQNTDDISVTVELTNGSTITVTRNTAATIVTEVWVLLIEYTGSGGGVNEFIVRDRRVHAWGAGTTTQSYGPIAGVSNTADVVVFNGGAESPNTGSADYDRVDVRAFIDGASSVQLARGDGTNTLNSVHQVVEFTGSNWTIQQGDAVPAQDTGGTDVAVTAVSAISDVWVYFNWQTNVANLDERGHRLWLTSTTNLRVQEHAAATGTKNIRWYLIENTDLNVQTGAADDQFATDTQNSITGFTAVTSLGRSFAWVHGMTNGGGNAHPRDMWQFELSNTSTINLERGYDGQNLDYRYYVVELPLGNNPDVQQLHYHWRNDDGSEAAATSATSGSEDTVLTGVTKGSNYRLRMGVSNEGTAASSAIQYRLEFAQKSSTCATATGWTDVGAVGGAFDMFDSGNITDGNDTTNIAEAVGGVTDENTTFETPNAALKDTSSQTAAITLSSTDYVDLEYSISVSSTADFGLGYCFRVTDAGADLNTYVVYAELSIEDQVTTIGEYGTVTLTGDTSQVVNLTNDYSDLIVVASARYAPTTDVQRAPRVIAKTNGTSASFEIKVDNEANSLVAESTTVDYMVMEAGVHFIEVGGSTRQVIAASENVSGIFCNTDTTSGTATTVTFSPAFSSAPAVLHTVTSNVDTTWTVSLVDDGTLFDNEPTTTTARFHLNRSFASCTHGAEDIDYIALEEGFGLNNSVEMDAVVGPDITACCNGTGYATPFNDTFSSAPGVALIAQMGEDGGNGAYAIKHTGTANSTTTFFGGADEDGPAADRTHTAEVAAVVAFNAASGTIRAQTNYNAKAFRWYNNTDSADVGSALAAQDTTATLAAVGDAFRLRQLVDYDTTFGLNGVGSPFKLQFAQRSGTCDTGFAGETYADITSSSAIAFTDNATPTDGTLLIDNVNDPDLTETVHNQTYNDADEGATNTFTNSERAIPYLTDGLWDFALFDNTATPGETYCIRMAKNNGDPFDTYTVIPEITMDIGVLTVDIVDGVGASVASPTVVFTAPTFSFSDQSTTGTLGVSAERIRALNTTSNPQWSMTIAATGGTTALWDSAGTDFDFNDPTASAGDGGDADAFGGQLTIDPSGATITPEAGCSSMGITLGTSTGFSEGVTDSVTLATAGLTAEIRCYWEFTDISLSQTIPPEQPAATDYDIDMTISIVAI